MTLTFGPFHMTGDGLLFAGPEHVPLAPKEERVLRRPREGAVKRVICGQAIALIAVLAAAAPAWAEGHGHEAGHGDHKHHFSYLVGLSDNGAIDETAFTVGLGYRYALSDRFAIGPSVDWAFYDHEDTTLLVAALYWKPAGNLLLMAGPGVELIDYKGSSSGSSHDTRTAAASESAHEDESKFAFRVGAGYELHVRGVTVTPAVGADFIDGHTTLVYAVAIGFGL